MQGDGCTRDGGLTKSNECETAQKLPMKEA